MNKCKRQNYNPNNLERLHRFREETIINESKKKKTVDENLKKNMHMHRPIKNEEQTGKTELMTVE